MSRLTSCGTLAAGVPLLTQHVGEMSSGMNLDALIAAPLSKYNPASQSAPLSSYIYIYIPASSEASKKKIELLQASLAGSKASVPPPALPEETGILELGIRV